ncbi:MAG: hypothetical protein WCJ40_12970 [Planctomycetota bacterium]
MKVNFGPDTSVTLIERMQLRDAAAWKHFFENYQSVLFRIARSSKNVDDDLAEEISMSVIAGLYEHFKNVELNHCLPFREYLARQVNNEIRKHWKHCSRMQSTLTDRLVDVLKGDEVELPRHLWLFAEEVSDDLANRIDRMNKVIRSIRARVERETWKIYYDTEILNQSIAETAIKHKISEAAVKMRRSRIKKMIREEVEKLQGI